jgi:hypothetical protein
MELLQQAKEGNVDETLANLEKLIAMKKTPDYETMSILVDVLVARRDEAGIQKFLQRLRELKVRPNSKIFFSLIKHFCAQNDTFNSVRYFAWMKQTLCLPTKDIYRLELFFFLDYSCL